MTIKRTLLISITLVFLLTVGLGAIYAQGSRNGQRGSGQRGNAAGQQSGAGQGQQLQLHVPGTGTTTQQSGVLQSGGQGRMGRSQGQSMSGIGLGMAQYSTMEPFTGELTADVVEALEAGWADEQHAYAVYQAVIDQFGAVTPFTSIQRAEAGHAAALESAFAYYGLELPTAPAQETLTFDSLTDACAAAVDAEIANMALYDSWLATVSDYPDLVQIFTSLRDASEFNHLPAFQSCAG